MAKTKHLKFLTSFKKSISKEIPLHSMYLFGSRAKGNPKRWSDFDILLVSGKFKKMPSYERQIGFHKHWTMDYPVDFLCYTPEEFNRLKKQVTIVREAVKEGIEI